VAPTISIIIAMALYVATYLSFVRLLRYPRNWNLPALPLSLTTGALVIVTVSYVSISPIGVEAAALVILAGFIAVLFSIIAAPAIAFRPASRWIEFLARHGDYAGLWVLAPAIAAYAALNVKLLGLLAAAVAIELVWFLPHRANDRRRLYPIVGHDLSVLKAQANGDIEGFARQHGIHELVLSDGTVNWRGCGKETLPCPFNLYINRLGLNTAPCCREHLAELCHYVASCLRDMRVVHWLEGGTLLGAVRESGRLLAWEDDIDLSVVLDNGTTFDSLAAGLAECGARDGYYVDVFKNKRFIAISYDPPGVWPFSWGRYRMRGEIRLDLAVYRHVLSHGKPVLERKILKGAMPLTESGGYGVPREIVLPTSTIAFLGGNIACPNQPKEYLRLIYGDFGEVVYTYVDAAAAKTRWRAADPPRHQ
ncbi:MAG: hypothetical protein O7D31_02855, partial [Alphaproteobacteria bacterium]|nr:hypothetical protein [Alphaproteobacteria bacterium]